MKIRFLSNILSVNTLRPRQDGHHFPDDIFKCIFLNENEWIALKTSLKFVRKGPINNIPPLVQIMAWHRPGDKPLSEPMMVNLPTYICVTRPQWVNKKLLFFMPLLSPFSPGKQRSHTFETQETNVLFIRKHLLISATLDVISPKSVGKVGTT